MGQRFVLVGLLMRRAADEDVASEPGVAVPVERVGVGTFCIAFAIANNVQILVLCFMQSIFGTTSVTTK